MLTNQTTTAPCLYFLNKFYHQHKIIYLKQFRPSICFLCMCKMGRLNLVPPQPADALDPNEPSRHLFSRGSLSTSRCSYLLLKKRKTNLQPSKLRNHSLTGAKCRGASVVNMNYYQNHDADKKSIPRSPVKLSIPRVRCASVNISRNRRDETRSRFF